MDEALNAVNDAQTGIVDGQAPEIETGVEGEQATEPQENPKPAQPEDENRAFAQQRRAREAAQREAQEYKTRLERYEQMASVLGFKGENDEETMANAMAHAYGVTPEEWRAEQERIREEMLNSPEFARLKAENEALKSKEYDRIIGSDLKEIQGVDPQVKSLDDLGERFLQLRAAGVDNLTAYHAVKAAASKKPVAQMGDIKPGAAEKGFFTCDEVKAMSPAEVSKNYEKIEKSMSKWR